MYLNLLPKQQIGYIRHLLQQRQLSYTAIVAIRSNYGHRKHEHGQDSRVSGQYFQFSKQFSAMKATGKLGKSASGVLESDDGASVEGELGTDVLEDIDAELSNYSLKSVLYQETDEILKSLNNCKDYERLLQEIEKSMNHFKVEHYVQSIILLWTYCHEGGDVVGDAILKHPVFERLLTNVCPLVPHMNIHEIGCSYLYLRKMGVPTTHVTLRDLLLRAVDVIEQTTGAVPLSALSRIVVGINTGHDIYIPLVCCNFMLQIETHIKTCTTAAEARLLAICVLNLQRLVCNETLELFKERLRQMLDNNILGAHTPKAIVKVLHMLNMPHWSNRNAELLRTLLLALRTTMNELSDAELKTASRIFQYHLEPAGLAQPLMKATQLQLHKHTTPDSLNCYVPFVQPRNREVVFKEFRKLIASPEAWQLPNASATFFAILRGLKIADVRICDTYWTRVLDEMEASPKELLHLRFLRHCHRYMNFNNNLGGTYRHIQLERRLSGLALQAIDTDIGGHIPSKFARLAAFVLAYGHTPYSWKKFPNIILSKIITMADQLSIIDCYFLSRGLQIAMELRFRHNVPPILKMQVATIDNVLTTCAERQIGNDCDLTTSDLNTIVRTLGSRKSLKNTVIYQQALNKYKELNFTDLNSRNVREMAFNLTNSGFLVPRAMEAMLKYVVDNREHIMGDTVEKVITCAYHLGYTPQSLEVLHHAATIFMRDFEFMSGLSLVQGCLGLCYYKTMPENLINKVFCAHFIKRVEEEIQACYSKATYPERVQNLIMQLNRTVCLDFPEANVPWFQQNYLEAHLSRKPALPTKFSEEITNLLQITMKDKNYFRCNHITPYGYQIDFVIHFDRNKNPITAPAETTMLDRITKVAILLLKLDSFCENDLTILRGPQTLKIKHLEMMGYKVLHINEHDWNSKYMNAPGAKANYLKCLLQISS